MSEEFLRITIDTENNISVSDLSNFLKALDSQYSSIISAKTKKC